MRQCMRLPIPEALLAKVENGSERLGLTVSIAILINVWIWYLKSRSSRYIDIGQR